MATQQQRIEKVRANFGNAQGPVVAAEYLARDPGQALSAFTSKLETSSPTPPRR